MDFDVNIYEPVLTIGTVAKKLNISVQTLRLYEQEGLILPFKTATGRRMYSLHDVERLRCIRTSIKEHGINLQGIKRLISMVPCWEFKGGLDNQCRNCPAYYEADRPCWSIDQVGEKCKLEDCRTCPVYRIEISCQKIKEVIYGHRKESDRETK